VIAWMQPVGVAYRSDMMKTIYPLMRAKTLSYWDQYLDECPS
jgi:hypothetical protein